MLINAVFYRSTENFWSEPSPASIYYLGNLKRFKALLFYSIRGTVPDLVLGEAVKNILKLLLSCHGLNFDGVTILQIYKKLPRDTTVLYNEGLDLCEFHTTKGKGELKICSAKAGTYSYAPSPVINYSSSYH
jgi:hypothetical protein